MKKWRYNGILSTLAMPVLLLSSTNPEVKKRQPHYSTIFGELFERPKRANNKLKIESVAW